MGRPLPLLDRRGGPGDLQRPVPAQGPSVGMLFPSLGTTQGPGEGGPAVVSTLGCSLLWCQDLTFQSRSNALGRLSPLRPALPALAHRRPLFPQQALWPALFTNRENVAFRQS